MVAFAFLHIDFYTSNTECSTMFLHSSYQFFFFFFYVLGWIYSLNLPFSAPCRWKGLYWKWPYSKTLRRYNIILASQVPFKISFKSSILFMRVHEKCFSIHKNSVFERMFTIRYLNMVHIIFYALILSRYRSFYIQHFILKFDLVLRKLIEFNW